MKIENEKRVSKIWGKKQNKVAFIFSCPGQKEYIADRKAMKKGIKEKDRNCLVNGTTGKNLEILLKMLKDSHPKIFPFMSKVEYRITNSSDIVHFKNNGNGTEPSKKEIGKEENRKRLIDDLRGYEFIFTFGAKADDAMNMVRDELDMANVKQACKVTVIKAPYHVGMQGINHIKLKPAKTKKPTNTERRLRIVHDMIVAHLTEIEGV